MKISRIINKLFSCQSSSIILTIVLLLILPACESRQSSESLEISFDKGYGQVEVGGKYAGMEFHKSRPVPSRISFYYPVANSIDLSTDYWKRYESLPLKITTSSDGIERQLGLDPANYTYTPYQVRFDFTSADVNYILQYDVCENLPIIVVRMKIENDSGHQTSFNLETELSTTLRTSHSYQWKSPSFVQYPADGKTAFAKYNDIETDSAALFILDTGKLSGSIQQNRYALLDTGYFAFNYTVNLDHKESTEIVQLIGTCKQEELTQILNRVREEWSASVHKNEKRVLDYAEKNTFFAIENSNLLKTARWSKAVIASNLHYINGTFMPMPCPAEYNFFFTHDLLVTSLGALFYDLEYVKNGLEYIQSHTKEDNIIPHAYYWKDDKYATEYCPSDNWNHLWFIITAASYYRHSDDRELLISLLPLLKKSLTMMLENRGADGLMHAMRPDWWDTGNRYGARAYITTLMYRAMMDYAYLHKSLGFQEELRQDHLAMAEKMKTELNNKLWDDKTGYLLNMLDAKSMDYHYYSGSLLSAYYGLLSPERSKILLETARTELLEENIGIYNAMPMDFHELIDVYKFNGMESGEPFYYFNGGVWNQGNAWYALALIQSGMLEEAENALSRYLSLGGILNSPNGQPSFYEYRITDPNSEHYGEIDKPTFLWMGGWYLNVLYQLAGVRENSWNMSFSPEHSKSFEEAEYDLSVAGELCRIKISGEGQWFKNIVIDGKQTASAVLMGPAKNVRLERGNPKIPYVASINCDLIFADFNGQNLTVKFSGLPEQAAAIRIVSPILLQEITPDDETGKFSIQSHTENEIQEYNLNIPLTGGEQQIHIMFQ